MTCENCGMGFFISPINIYKQCPHCGHVHAPLILQEEDNMVKKIILCIYTPCIHKLHIRLRVNYCYSDIRDNSYYKGSLLI